MRQSFLFSILFGMLSLSALQQISVSVVSDNQEGFSSRMTSYITQKFGQWQIDNITFAKFSEETETLEETYLRNYLRNKLSLTRTLSGGMVQFFGSVQLSPADNFPSHVGGVNGEYLLENGWGLGANIHYQVGNLLMDANLRYNIRDYSGDEDITEFDTRNNVTLTWMQSDTWMPVIALEHFDDLNEEDVFNYYTAGAGIQTMHYFGRPHIWQQQLILGQSDRYDDVPYFVHYTTRFSTKLHPDWMLVQKLDIQNWYDTENNEMLLGKSFGESIVQRTISTEGNRINRIRLAAKHCFYDEETLLKANMQYNLWQLVFFAEYNYYLGNVSVNDMGISGELGGFLLHDSLRIGYRYDVLLRDTVKDRLTHGISLAYRY